MPGHPPESTPFDIGSAFSGRIQRVRPRPLYLCAMAVVTCVMALLPVAYLVIIVALGALVYLHAVENIGMISRAGGASRIAALLYAAPILAGIVAVFFLIKPLLAPREEPPEPYTLRPGEEPRLEAFVKTLCSMMGAPVPSRIDVDCTVNASASFRRGMISFIGSDLVLTIGLPLVAGLSFREFTGVLAHEFGHFAQGGGMRMNYVIRRINAWLIRVAHDRDEWDDRLAEWRQSSQSLYAALAVAMISLLVWCSRVILGLLARAGVAASAMLSRRMEFDADAWEARVVGSEAAAGTFDRLTRLSLARSLADSEIRARSRGGELTDDIVAMILASEHAVPADVISRVRLKDLAAKTRWFDTHPSTSDRIRAMNAAAEPGVFRADGSAQVLFNAFGDLCRRASYLTYKNILGERIFETRFVPASSVAQAAATRRARIAAGDNYLLGLLHPAVPLQLSSSASSPPADARAALAELRAVRDLITPHLADANRRAAESDTLRARLCVLKVARELSDADLVVVPVRFNLKDRHQGTVRAALDECRRALADTEGPARQLADLLSRRLSIALSLMHLPAAAKKIPDAAQRSAEIASLVPALAPLVTACAHLANAVHSRALAYELTQALKRKRDVPVVTVHLDAQKHVAFNELQAAAAILRGHSLAIDSGDPVQLAATIVGEAPPITQPVDLFLHASRCEQISLRVYSHVLTRLAEHAATVETALGLPPLQTPASSPT